MVRTGVLGCATLAVILGQFQLISWYTAGGLICVLLIGYQVAEIYCERIVEGPYRVFASPAVISSVVIFGIGFGVGWAALGRGYYKLSVSNQWYSYTAVLALLASTALWFGYCRKMPKRVANVAIRTFNRLGVLKFGMNPRWSVAIGLYLVSVALRLAGLKFGWYGWSEGGNVGSTSDLGTGTQLVNIVIWSRVYVLSLFGMWAGRVRQFGNRYASAVAVAAVLIEAGLGLLAGVKAQVIIPVFMVGIGYYIGLTRIPWKALLAAAVVLVATFGVAEGYRTLARQVDVSREVGITDRINILEESISSIGDVDSASVSRLWDLVLSRTSFLHFATVAVRHRDQPWKDVPNELTRRLYLSPLSALVPRLVWPNKPRANLGGWFNRSVLQRRSDASVSMSPVGYLYIIGGVTGVIAGLFMIGTVQRVFYEGIRSTSSGAVLIAMGALWPLVWLDSEVYTLVVHIIRYTVIGGLLQIALLRQ